MTLGAQRPGQARADPAAPDHDDVHGAQCNTPGSGPPILLLCRGGDDSDYRGRYRPPPKVTPRPPGSAGDEIPETFRYRLKNRLLGPPLVTEQLATERLRKPIALGVLGARLHFVVGLRHRGDADPAGAFRRTGRLHLGCAHHPRHSRRPLLRDPVVPRCDRALHEGWRLLRGGAGQFRTQGRSGRCRRPSHRLHGHGRRADLGRHGRTDQRGAQPRQHVRHRRHHGGCRADSPVRQPARHSRGRQLLRHPHLLLHLLAGVGHRRRLRQGGRRRRCTRSRCRPPHQVFGGRIGHARLGLAVWAWPSSSLLRLRQRRFVAHRAGGHLQRRQQLPTPRGTQRPPDAGGHELHPGLPRLRGHHAGQVDPRHPLRPGLAHRGLPGGQGGLRHQPGRPPGLLRGAAGHHADPLHRRQHQLQRVPLPGQLRGRRPLPAPPADQARPPARLLQRDPGAGRRGAGAGPGLQGPGERAGGALRHRRVHRIHVRRCGDGQAPP